MSTRPPVRFQNGLLRLSKPAWYWRDRGGEHRIERIGIADIVGDHGINEIEISTTEPRLTR